MGRKRKLLALTAVGIGLYAAVKMKTSSAESRYDRNASFEDPDLS